MNVLIILSTQDRNLLRRPDELNLICSEYEEMNLTETNNAFAADAIVQKKHDIIVWGHSIGDQSLCRMIKRAVKAHPRTIMIGLSDKPAQRELLERAGCRITMPFQEAGFILKENLEIISMRK